MLENRNGRTYHYRAKRMGDRVRRVYTGADELARVQQELDEIEREEREAEREAEAARLEDLRAEIGESAENIGEAVRLAEKVVAGRMKRLGVRRVGSRWRRERGKAMNGIAAIRPNTRDIQAAEKRVPAAMMGRFGLALHTLPESLDAKAKEFMKAEAVRLAEELAGERPTPSEWYLSLLIALAGLEMMAWELTVAGLAGLGSPRRFDVASRHLNRLRRQQASALKDLAAIRRYEAATIIQVGTMNVAEQQVVQNAPAPAAEQPAKVIEAKAMPAKARAKGGRRA
jgi:hypothetical protein